MIGFEINSINTLQPGPQDIMIVTCLSNLAMAACIGSLDRSALITSSCAIFQSNGMAGVVGSEAIRKRYGN